MRSQTIAGSSASELDGSQTSHGAGGGRRGLAALSRIVTVVLFGLVLVAGFVLYGMLDNRWYHVVAVEGGSMAPTIQPGELIVITRPPSRIQAGMILTLEVDGAVVTHRVVEVRNDGTFITQGDANTTRDDFSANRVRVVGEYRFGIPWLGRLLATAQSVVSGAFLVTSVQLNVDGTIGEAPTTEEVARLRIDRETSTAPERHEPSPTDPPPLVAPSDTLPPATDEPDGSTTAPPATAGPDPSPEITPEPTIEAVPEPTPSPVPEPTVEPSLATPEPTPEPTSG